MDSLELRKIIRAKFAWPGGYEMFGVCNDGAILCCDCMRKEYRQIAHAQRHGLHDGWRIIGADSMANCDAPQHCEHCGRDIK